MELIVEIANSHNEDFRFLFKIKKLRNVCKDVALPNYMISKHRLTIDYASDLTMFNKLFKLMKEKKININLENIINFLNKNKKIAQINKNSLVIYRNKIFLKNMFKILN